MPFQQLLLIDFATTDFPERLWAELREAVPRITLLSKNSPNLSEEMALADAIGVRLGTTFGAAEIARCPKLRYLGMYGTGYGRIDTEAASKHGILVCNVADYATEAVAEFAFAAVLAHLRELPRGLLQARSGDYSESTFNGSELRGKRFGIVGLGHIGARIAEIARHGFGSDVVYWSRGSRSPDDSCAFAELDILLSTSTFVSLNLALTAETKNIFDERRIALLPPQAILMNLSPMELLDLRAVEARLQKGDVTVILDHSDEMNPVDVKRLIEYPSCIIYPPIAYTTAEAGARKQQIFIDNIRNAVLGSPTNRVN